MVIATTVRATLRWHQLATRVPRVVSDLLWRLGMCRSMGVVPRLRGGERGAVSVPTCAGAPTDGADDALESIRRAAPRVRGEFVDDLEQPHATQIGSLIKLEVQRARAYWRLSARPERLMQSVTHPAPSLRCVAVTSPRSARSAVCALSW